MSLLSIAACAALVSAVGAETDQNPDGTFNYTHRYGHERTVQGTQFVQPQGGSNVTQSALLSGAGGGVTGQGAANVLQSVPVFPVDIQQGMLGHGNTPPNPQVLGDYLGHHPEYQPFFTGPNPMLNQNNLRLALGLPPLDTGPVGLPDRPTVPPDQTLPPGHAAPKAQTGQAVDAATLDVTGGQAIAQAFPASPVGSTMMGDGYSAQNKPGMAVQAYTRAMGIAPSPQLQYKRGLAAEKAGDPELANADARAVLGSEPADAMALALEKLTRGRVSSVHLLDGELAAAAGKSEPGRPATGGAGTAPAGGPEATAAEIAAAENAAMNSRPVSAQSARLTLEARSALQVGDAPKALALAEQALRVDPDNAEAYYVEANAYLRQGDNAAAARALSAGLDLAPGNGPLAYTRAIANGRQKLWQEAYKDAEQAVRSAPRKGYGYQVRAGVNWGLGQRDAMMADLKTAASLDPKYAADLRRATQVPADVDPTLLFGDANAAAAQLGAPSKAGPGSRSLLWFVGAGLAAAGLLPFLFPGVRKRATTILRRAPAAGDADAAPASGFWRRYEVTREIGAGGMGVVYEAKDLGLERRVAVKRMRDEIRGDRRERERFLQEARTVAKLRHPNLVEIYSIEEDGDDAYLVFEFVDGNTLHDIIEDKGRLTPVQARELFRGVCAGVDYAHRKGFVHRDLKPANIMVQSDGTVKVMDFGVARQAQDALARRQLTNTVIGTPQYMAPEQENGVVCAQSDVYALGVCLYEALSGAPPFAGTAGAVTLAKLEARYEPVQKRVAGLPAGLARLIERALDPKPETRIQSAAEFQKELDAAVAGVAA